MKSEFDIIKITSEIKNFLGEFIPEIGIITGSGIDISSEIKKQKEIDFQDIGMPMSFVQGHKSKITFGFFEAKKVILMPRFHYYESGDMDLVRLPFQILHSLGVNKIILQSSCAGLNETYEVGQIVCIKDHFNFVGTNPLIGLKPIKFLNLSNLYDKTLIEKVVKISSQIGVDVKMGVHMQFAGPNYETTTDLKFAKLLAVDTVSMSLVFDALLSSYYDMKVLAFGIVTNLVNKTSSKSLSHIEVLNEAKKTNSNFSKLLKHVITNL